MQLAEIRDLDGPNLFLGEPAIKLEVICDSTETQAVLASRIAPGNDDLTDAATAWLAGQYATAGFDSPRVTIRPLEDEGHLAIAWSWEHRTFAIALAKRLFAVLTGQPPTDLDPIETDLTWGRDDAPSMVRDEDRHAIAIGVTGTNGKTTTTRLIAHIARTAGFCTGWNSSSGIYIDGEEIEAGDYSGPSGARRILQDESVAFAVLETARGGILLRGLGYQSNDVSVFTNISPDHLDLQGVRTVEVLAEVKSVVCRATKPTGTVVVNADDPVVLAAVFDIPTKKTYFTRKPTSEIVTALVASGEMVISYADQTITVQRGSTVLQRAPIGEIPIAYGGRAGHMIENAMAAIGACLAAGIAWDQITAGLASFTNDAEHNPGRLNIYDINGTTVILDFAHNEAGLAQLIEFARSDLADSGRLISIIGTAGDRTDDSLFAIGKVAAEQSDIVIAKGTSHYLRGRSLESIMERYRSGAEAGGVRDYRESESEVTATLDALALARPGDCIVIMAQEHVEEIRAHLSGEAQG